MADGNRFTAFLCDTARPGPVTLPRTMGFLDRLRGRDAPRPAQPSPDEPGYWSRFEGHARINVVGESLYQGAIIKSSGAPARGEFRSECTAHLVPEPTNPHDKFAVRVEIDGRHVGYLARGSARRYHRRLAVMLADGQSVSCFALVARRAEGNPNLGVSLWLPKDHPLFTKLRTTSKS